MRRSGIPMQRCSPPAGDSRDQLSPRDPPALRPGCCIVTRATLPEVGGPGAWHTDPLRGRCVPYSSRAIASTFQVVLGVGPAFDDAPHHLPLAHATGRVWFLRRGSTALTWLGFRSRSTRSTFRSSLGFTAVYLVGYNYVRGWCLKQQTVATIPPVPRDLGGWSFR